MSANIEIYRELYKFWKREEKAYVLELKRLMKTYNEETKEDVKNKLIIGIHDIIMERNDRTEQKEYYKNLLEIEHKNI